MRHYRTHRGSALLVALMIMGILLTLALGVSDLLISTLHDSRLLVERTKAWYAAESGVEQALFAAGGHGPGYGKTDSIDVPELHYQYAIGANATKIPNKELYEINFDKDSPESYSQLRLNESVVIPMFRTTDMGDTDPVKHFRVEYYLPPELQQRGGATYTNLDILRWKMFGIANNSGKMEVINEFIPMRIGQNTANNPSCLGNSTLRNDCWNVAIFFQFNPDSTEYEKVESFPIETFIQQHTQNFLVLTNIVNTDLMASSDLTSEEKQKIANIQYRVIEEDEDQTARLTLPVIKITSDGFAGEAKQSLNVEMKREMFLPVFNYALYRTAGNDLR